MPSTKFYSTQDVRKRLIGLDASQPASNAQTMRPADLDNIRPVRAIIRCRKKFGGLEVLEAKRLKALEEENAQEVAGETQFGCF